jgi:hypothetical protein
LRELDEHSITDEVLRRFEGCENPRLKQLLGGLVRHLHDFVLEGAVTEAEWVYAIDFLTLTGKITDQSRQEFILLSPDRHPADRLPTARDRPYAEAIGMVIRACLQFREARASVQERARNSIIWAFGFARRRAGKPWGSRSPNRAWSA